MAIKDKYTIALRYLKMHQKPKLFSHLQEINQFMQVETNQEKKNKFLRLKESATKVDEVYNELITKIRDSINLERTQQGNFGEIDQLFKLSIYKDFDEEAHQNSILDDQKLIDFNPIISIAE